MPDPNVWHDGLELALSGTDLHLDKMQWRIGAGGEIHDGGPAVIDEDGEYHLFTRALDEAGNDSGWRDNPVKVDATAPDNTTAAAPTGWRKTPYTVEVTGDDDGSGVDYIERTIDGGAVSTDPNVTITGDGVHTLRTRIFDVVGHASEWREETIKIDTAAPQAALACSSAADAWSRVRGQLQRHRRRRPLRPRQRDARGRRRRHRRGGQRRRGDGQRRRRPHAPPRRRRRRGQRRGGRGRRPRGPQRAGGRAVAAPPPTASTPAAPTRPTAPRAWPPSAGASTAATFETIAAGGSFTVAKGQVRLRAVDVAGNETITDPVTLAAIAKTVKVRISSVPVYLKGHKDADSMLGALNAVRSASGTVSLDLRPLAVGRGSYRVEIRAQVRQALQALQAHLQGRPHRRPAAHQRLAEQGDREDHDHADRAQEGRHALAQVRRHARSFSRSDLKAAPRLPMIRGSR